MRHRYFPSQNSDSNSVSITTTTTPHTHHPITTAAGRAANATAMHCCHRQLMFAQVIQTADETNAPKTPAAVSRYLFFGVEPNTTHLMSSPSVSCSTIYYKTETTHLNLLRSAMPPLDGLALRAEIFLQNVRGAKTIACRAQKDPLPALAYAWRSSARVENL